MTEHERDETPAEAAREPVVAKIPARVLVRAVRLYQLAHQGRVPSCRFVPTCSAYALAAVQAHGAFRGTWLAVRRLLRCHPWGSSGFDPVPPPAADRLAQGSAGNLAKARTC